jgi:Tetratricopeptide repeat
VLIRVHSALPHCQEAVRLQPDLAAAHHNLGNALRALGRLVDARSAGTLGRNATARPIISTPRA